MMKRILLSLAAVVVLSGTAYAQRPIDDSTLAPVNSGDATNKAERVNVVANATGATSAKQDTGNTAITLLHTDNATGDSFKMHASTGTAVDKFTVKAGVGVLDSVTATNTNALPAYLRCNNDTSGNTAAGSETEAGTLVLDLAIPGATSGSGYHIAFPHGAAFSTGLVCWIATEAAASGSNPVVADEVKIFITYR